MSKCRSMYAGSSGSVYNANTMHEGNGNGKWQGLVSTTNMRSRLIPYVRTRADSDNRNVVFCMNQLGGIGRKSTMFASTADGVNQPCPGSVNNPWWYNNQAILAAATLLHSFVQTKTGNEAGIGLIGDHETTQNDHITGSLGYIAPFNSGYEQWLFEPFIGSHIAQTASNKVMAAANLLNSMKIRAWVNGKYMVHEVGIIGKKVPDNTPDHGLGLGLSDRLIIGVYGDKCGLGSDPDCRGKPVGWISWIGAYNGVAFSKCPKNCGTGWCRYNRTDIRTGANDCECQQC